MRQQCPLQGNSAVPPRPSPGLPQQKATSAQLLPTAWNGPVRVSPCSHGTPTEHDAAPLHVRWTVSCYGQRAGCRGLSRAEEGSPFSFGEPLPSASTPPAPRHSTPRTAGSWWLHLNILTGTRAWPPAERL